MWHIKDFKTTAWQRLKPSYWKAFGVCLLASIGAGGTLSLSLSSSGGLFGGFDFDVGDKIHIKDFQPDNFEDAWNQGIDVVKNYFVNLFQGYSQEQVRIILIIAIAVLGLAMLASFAVTMFVGYPLLIGQTRFFEVNTKYDAPFNEIGFGFRKGSYMHFVITIFWKQFKIFLWSLLLFFPGLIKKYEYSMVPYLLAENPEISRQRAFELSKQFTKGEKWNLFVLDLSFLGWFLLGTLCLGIGVLFVVPYREATVVEFYRMKREEMIQNGVVSRDELPDVEAFGKQ